MKTCPACASDNADSSDHCAACGARFWPEQTTTVVHVPRPLGDSPECQPDSSCAMGGQFLPGTSIAGRYRIVVLAGRGGMGDVYRADDLTLGQPVALKFLPRDVARDARLVQVFLNEVRLSRRITHPNVCRVHDVDQVDDQYFLSMEYIDGENLQSLLRRIGRLPTDKGIEISTQLCAGLAAAHEIGVLHRDLKPANVMIDGRGHARITDFGLARVAPAPSNTFEICGTPGYMAPEQLARGEATVQSDIHSLGLVLYEVFTGRPVHTDRSLEGVRRAYEAPFPPSLAELAVLGEPRIKGAILHCLHRDPDQRPRSVKAVADALSTGRGRSPESSRPASSADSGPSIARASAYFWVILDKCKVAPLRAYG